MYQIVHTSGLWGTPGSSITQTRRWWTTDKSSSSHFSSKFSNAVWRVFNVGKLSTSMK